MTYQTIETYATDLAENVLVWLTDDPIRIGYVLAGLAVLGAVRGIHRSLGYCKHTSHIGRRVL